MSKSISVNDLKFTNSSPMAREIRDRVSAYFKERKLSKKGDQNVHNKALFFFCAFWTNYYLLVFTQFPLWIKILLCISAVFFASGIGFCSMHEGSHGSFSEKKWQKILATNSARSLGVDMWLWKTKHEKIHHRGTNVNHIDDDIEARPFLRLHDYQPHYRIHKYQHRYWPFAYGLLFIWWVLGKDFIKYFSGKIMNVRVVFKFWDHVLFWSTKIFFIIFFIIIPGERLGWNVWWVGFALFVVLLGVIISIVFQLAHIVRGLKHPTFEEVNGGETFEHQISTTADFAPHSRFIRWWVGGLNFQIEHHLFPDVAHNHYPAIQKIVMDSCREHQVTMIIFPKALMALKSHIGKLKDFSKNPAVVV